MQKIFIKIIEKINYSIQNSLSLSLSIPFKLLFRFSLSSFYGDTVVLVYYFTDRKFLFESVIVQLKVTSFRVCMREREWGWER